MKRFALSYFTAVTTLLIVISSTGMSTGKNNTGLTRSNRPGQNSKRYFKAEYTTDFSPLQPSVNVQTESIKSYRTAGNNPRLSTVGSSSIRKLPAARETSLNRDNAKAMALSLRSRFRFSKLDSVSPDFYRFNDNYKAKVNNRSLLSAYGAKVMSKFAAMPVEIRRSFPTISRHVTLTPYSFTGDVEEIMRMGPGKMKSRVQNLPTSVTDQYRRSRVRRRAQREDVINGLLADGSDVLMRGERSELNDDSQHSSLYKWLDDTHLNKNTNDYLNEIFKGVYMWLAQPETESELAPVSFTSDSLDGRYLDDTHTFLEERNNERTSQYLDEMLLPSLADTDEYGSDTDNGFSAVSKRGKNPPPKKKKKPLFVCLAVLVRRVLFFLIIIEAVMMERLIRHVLSSDLDVVVSGHTLLNPI